MTEEGWEETNHSILFNHRYPELFQQARTKRLVRLSCEESGITSWWRLAVPWFNRVMTWAEFDDVTDPAKLKAIGDSIELGQPTPELEAYLTLWWMGGGT